MIAICQVKSSPVGTAISMWEWKSAELPLGSRGTALPKVIPSALIATLVPNKL
jgi:hypothetical protein